MNPEPARAFTHRTWMGSLRENAIGVFAFTSEYSPKVRSAPGSAEVQPWPLLPRFRVALIATGRAFERTLLGIRERMIAIHPMTQMLEEAPIRDQVARELRVSRDLQFILRAGYLKRYPDPVSLRMPVPWFVTALA